MSDDSSGKPSPDPAPPPEAFAPEAPSVRMRIGTASWTLFVMLICAAVFRVGYGILVRHHLSQGVAMFVGLPLVLGTIVALLTFPKSPLGMVLKVTTLVLCIVAPLLEEGAICIAMAAPIIFAMIGLGALLVRLLSPSMGRGKASCCAALLAFVPFIWDPAQKGQGWEDRRPIDEVSDSLVIAASPAAVWQALDQAPVDPQAAPIPGFMRLRLKAGMRKVTGHGLSVGNTRDIYFDQDHYVSQVTQSVPDHEVVFAVHETAAAPGERIALWLRFTEVRFVLQDLGDGHTRLTQFTRYRRLLDPALYFAPLERQGVHAMHRYTLALLTQSLKS